jgi:hypothetical protein
MSDIKAWGKIWEDEQGANLARYGAWWTIGETELIARTLSGFRRRVASTRRIPYTKIASLELKEGMSTDLVVEVSGGKRETLSIVEEKDTAKEFFDALRAAIDKIER